VAGGSGSWFRFCPITSNPHPEQLLLQPLGPRRLLRRQTLPLLSQASRVLRGIAPETPVKASQTPTTPHQVSFAFGLAAGLPLRALHDYTETARKGIAPAN